jgi:hypothetical protein
MASRVFVFDLETDRLLNKSRNNFHELKMTCAVGIDGDGNRFDYMLLPESSIDEHKDVLDALAHAFDNAEIIVIYNGLGFDLKILNNHFSPKQVIGWSEKLFDPFHDIRATTESWVKLDELLAANDLPQKTGSGIDAPEWWKSKKYNMTLDYCYHDTLGLYRLVMSVKNIRFPVKSYGVVRDWKVFDCEAAMNKVLERH